MSIARSCPPISATYLSCLVRALSTSSRTRSTMAGCCCRKSRRQSRKPTRRPLPRKRQRQSVQVRLRPVQAPQPPRGTRTGRSKKRFAARDRLPPPYRLARGYASMTRITVALLISLLSFHTREARAVDTTDQIATLVKGNSEFALDLYSRISQGAGNRFLSPYSISPALAMTYAGAQEETAVQIAKTLRFMLPPGQLHPAFHRLIAELHGRTSTQSAPDHPPDVQLFTANALWIQTGERILPDFQKRIEGNCQVGL